MVEEEKRARCKAEEINIESNACMFPRPKEIHSREKKSSMQLVQLSSSDLARGPGFDLIRETFRAFLFSFILLFLGSCASYVHIHGKEIHSRTRPCHPVLYGLSSLFFPSWTTV